MNRYYAKFTAFGSNMPKKVLTNFDLEKMVETTDEWIRTRTGMQERHIAGEEEAASDLAFAAAKQAIEASPVRYREIDMIIVATISGDYPFPSTACVIQNRLGLKSIPAFDVSAGCTGFIFAVDVARQYIENGMCQNILVIGVEILTKITNWKDRNTCVLFGDGAGAAIVSRAQPADISRVIDSTLWADGSQGEYLYQAAGGSRMPASHKSVDENLHTVYMEGNKIYKLAVRSMSSAVEEILKKNRLTPQDVDWVIPHQANLRIIEGVADKLRIPMSKFIVNIHKYGNMSSATVPVACDEAIRSQKIRRGDVMVLVAFGAGLTWGSVLARY